MSSDFITKWAVLLQTSPNCSPGNILQKTGLERLQLRNFWRGMTIHVESHRVLFESQVLDDVRVIKIPQCIAFINEGFDDFISFVSSFIACGLRYFNLFDGYDFSSSGVERHVNASLTTPPK